MKRLIKRYDIRIEGNHITYTDHGKALTDTEVVDTLNQQDKKIEDLIREKLLLEQKLRLKGD